MRFYSLVLRSIFWSATFFCSASNALAQTTVIFTPASPTAVNLITARVSYQGLACGFEPITTLLGTTVRTDIHIFSCVVGPPSGPRTEFVPFGPLPAGTYTYELYFQYDNDPPILQAQQPLVVGAVPSAPALTADLLAFLAAALALVALISLRRL
jgi:hypothetical protein